MSIGPIYIRADDGLYYKNPTVRGVYGGRRWFLCFDDEDPDELVMEYADDRGVTGAVELVEAILASIGIPCAIKLHHGPTSSRCMTEELSDFVPAFAYWVSPHSAYPARIFKEAGHVGTADIL